MSGYFVLSDEQKVHCGHTADGLAAQPSKNFIKSICDVFSFRQSLLFLQIHTVQYICQSMDLHVTQPLVGDN